MVNVPLVTQQRTGGHLDLVVPMPDESDNSQHEQGGGKHKRHDVEDSETAGIENRTDRCHENDRGRDDDPDQQSRAIRLTMRLQMIDDPVVDFGTHIANVLRQQIRGI
jgi:hypothetical protein